MRWRVILGAVLALPGALIILAGLIFAAPGVLLCWSGLTKLLKFYHLPVTLAQVDPRLSVSWTATQARPN